MIDGEDLKAENSNTELMENAAMSGNQRVRKPSTSDKGKDNEKLGILHPRAFTFLMLWYFFSACTLFLNKYILATLKSDPTLLGESCFTLCYILNPITDASTGCTKITVTLLHSCQF